MGCFTASCLLSVDFSARPLVAMSAVVFVQGGSSFFYLCFSCRALLLLGAHFCLCFWIVCVSAVNPLHGEGPGRLNNYHSGQLQPYHLADPVLLPCQTDFILHVLSSTHFAKQSRRTWVLLGISATSTHCVTDGHAIGTGSLAELMGVGYALSL